MSLERMNTTEFTTEEIGARPPRRSVRPHASGRHSTKKNARKWPSAMAVKVGICAFACALMFTMKALDVPAASQMVSGVKTAMNDETDLTEMLGKLQFVELPDALAVFSASERMAVPVSASSVTLESDAQYAKCAGQPGALVIAAAAGEVRAIGEDEAMGRYVRLSHADGLETVYYGFGEIQVEQGQPVRKKDTLGTLNDEGTLYMSVFQDGALQSPMDYLDITY